MVGVTAMGFRSDKNGSQASRIATPTIHADFRSCPYASARSVLQRAIGPPQRASLRRGALGAEVLVYSPIAGPKPCDLFAPEIYDDAGLLNDRTKMLGQRCFALQYGDVIPPLEVRCWKRIVK